jgi:D-beta-D-heptose 7-phosphate kinase/D-beta-D-heptose 1-phosphate adenosyltransferase
MSADLVELVDRLGRPRLLVVGDVMLDRYVWGDAARVSQEAPVMLLQADRREERLGGASSVATLLRALDAEVTLAGVVGADADGERIVGRLDELGVDRVAVSVDAGRPSTVKERYIGRAQQKHPQQILRVDYECRRPVGGAVEAAVIAAIEAAVPACDIVLVSDYDKGVCTPGVMAATVAAARSAGKRVLADPTRGGDYGKYSGCSAVTPNRLEAALATGRAVDSAEAALAAAGKLVSDLHLEAAVVTLDKDGMALAERSGSRQMFLTRPRQVYDITGAGDIVLATLGLALAAGADYPAAVRLANVAGGLEVERIGVATVSRDEIRADIWRAEFAAGGSVSKVRSPAEVVGELVRRRKLGQRIAFTNGCFDVLHAGHVQYLHEARAQADVLVVGVNSDASIRALKGPSRPINELAERAAVLAGLQSVDFVTVFDAPTPIALIEQIRPDVLVKGADYRKDEVAGAGLVESYGGRVHLAALREGLSSTNVIRRLLAA